MPLQDQIRREIWDWLAAMVKRQSSDNLRRFDIATWIHRAVIELCVYLVTERVCRDRADFHKYAGGQPGETSQRICHPKTAARQENDIRMRAIDNAKTERLSVVWTGRLLRKSRKRLPMGFDVGRVNHDQAGYGRFPIIPKTHYLIVSKQSFGVGTDSSLTLQRSRT